MTYIFQQYDHILYHDFFSTIEPCTKVKTLALRVFFKKNGPFPASFSLFSSFQYTVDSKQMFYINKFLLMTGFKPRTTGIGSDHSTN